MDWRRQKRNKHKATKSASGRAEGHGTRGEWLVNRKEYLSRPLSEKRREREGDVAEGPEGRVTEHKATRAAEEKTLTGGGKRERRP